MAKKIDVDKYVAGLFGRTEQYAENVRKYYAYAVEELLKISANQSLEMGDLFAFKDNKRINEKATIILRQLYSAVYGEIKRGVSAEWEYANLSADALIQSIFGKGIIKDNHFAHWFGRNQKAMDAFFARTQVNGGLNLSQKVWKYTGNLREEMELALSLSLGEGGSASSISRRVRQYLQEPDKLFRRIKIGVDANGEPLYKLSKKASEYHPGQGVYRSSYKNAMRLTRTETNMAYRSADYERWQQLPFVVGIEIKLSNNHNCVGIPKGRFVDICDDLDGVYPKDFKFTGWHPQCRCVSIPKLASVDEMLEYQEKVLNDEDVNNYHFKGEVKNMPKNFSDWKVDNQKRIMSSSSLPYWVRDNKKVIDRKKKRIKTEQEKKEIQDKWNERAQKHTLVIKTANNILKTAEEIATDNERIIKGEPLDDKSVNKVKNVPAGFASWIKDNAERIERTKSQPYFIRNNQGVVNDIQQGKIPQTAKPAHIVTKKPSSDIAEVNRRFGVETWEGEIIKLDMTTYNNSPISDIDLVELDNEMNDIFAKHGMPKLGRKIVIDADTVTISYGGERGSMAYIERVFGVRDNARYVNHEYFAVDEEYQGKGFSKDVIKAFYKQYRKNGTQYINVHANIDVGGYCWGKYGFYANDKKNVERAVRWRNLNVAEAKEIRNIIDKYYNDKLDDAAFPMIKIASLPYGRKALLNSSWYGRIDLFEEEQRHLFESYLGV